MKPKFEVVNHRAFKNTPDFMKQLKAHDETLRKVVGRGSDFSGFGFGERENGWETQTRAEADKIAAAIRKAGMAARVRRYGLIVAAVVVALAAIPADPASAQSRTYYDGQGRFAGTSSTRGDNRSFYDGQGQFAGSTIRHGNSSSFYDGQGRFVGSSVNTGPRR